VCINDVWICAQPAARERKYSASTLYAAMPKRLKVARSGAIVTEESESDSPFKVNFQRSVKPKADLRTRGQGRGKWQTVGVALWNSHQDPLLGRAKRKLSSQDNGSKTSPMRYSSEDWAIY